MKTTTKVTEYTLEANQRMAKQVQEFISIFNEVSEIIIKNKNAPKLKHNGKNVSDEPKRDNVIFLNPSIKIKFQKLLEEEKPFHEIIDIYDEWFDELYKLVIVNEPWLSHKSVMDHITEIWNMFYFSRDFGRSQERLTNFLSNGQPRPVPTPGCPGIP